VFNSLVDYSKQDRPSYTGIDIEIIKKIGNRVTQIPDNVNIHPMVKKIYQQRTISIAEEGLIDFATAEAIAFASLII
jgi:2-oxoglutarate dehydrogenase E1 component